MGLVVLTAVVMFVVCGGPMLDSTFLIGGAAFSPTPGKPGNPDNPEWVIEVAAAFVHGGGGVAVWTHILPWVLQVPQLATKKEVSSANVVRRTECGEIGVIMVMLGVVVNAVLMVLKLGFDFLLMARVWLVGLVTL